MYGLENKIGSKSDILLSLVQDLQLGQQIHFVEDRVETLEKVCRTPGLELVKMYLVDWGYTTPKQMEVAEGNSRIEIIDCERLDEIVCRHLL